MLIEYSRTITTKRETTYRVEIPDGQVDDLDVDSVLQCATYPNPVLDEYVLEHGTLIREEEWEADDGAGFEAHAELAQGPRFYIVSEAQGLVGSTNSEVEAERIGMVAAVCTARTVYVHDRLTETNGGK